MSATSNHAPDTLTPAPHWGDRAACGPSRIPRGTDPAIFYPKDLRQAAPAAEAQAKALCGWCPVKADCLRHALTFPEPNGVWGGLNEDERNEIRRRTVRREQRNQQRRNRAAEAAQTAPAA